MQPSLTSTRPLNARLFHAVVLSALVCGVGYLIAVLAVGWQEVAEAVKQVGWFGIGLSLGCSLINYLLRFVRWQLYLNHARHPIAWRTSLRYYLAGFALTTTPGKAGEAVRSVLLHRHGVPYQTSLAAFFSERLSDLIAIIILALLGASSYPQARPFILISMALVLAAFVALDSPRWLKQSTPPAPPRSGLRALPGLLLNLLHSARALQTRSLFAKALLLSLPAWLAEGLAFAWVLHLMELEVSTATAVAIYAIAMLVGALSFVPGGLGTTEVAAVGLLMAAGVELHLASAATMIMRLATLWFAVLLGSLALAREWRPLQSPELEQS